MGNKLTTIAGGANRGAIKRAVTCLDVFGISDIGKVRKKNEDSFCILGFKNGAPLGVCIIADGMGGHNSGEIASKIAVDAAREHFRAALDKNLNDDAAWQLISSTVKIANQAVFESAQKKSEQNGMGTTMAICLVLPEKIFIANVGDSRAYHITLSSIEKITVDHSIVAELLRDGKITEAEAESHPQKNLITRAVGTSETVDADIFERKIFPGESLILCTDGLTEELSDAEILKIAQKYKRAKTTAEKLVERANKKGGIDNITAVALKF